MPINWASQHREMIGKTSFKTTVCGDESKESHDKKTMKARADLLALRHLVRRGNVRSRTKREVLGRAARTLRVMGKSATLRRASCGTCDMWSRTKRETFRIM